MRPAATRSAAAGALPEGVHAARDYESLARQCIPAPTFEYLASGSGEGAALAANLAALAARTIRPRVLCDVGGGHTQLQLAGQSFAHPILLAPLAHQALVHPRGELETARGAAAADACMLLSTLSSFTLEEVAAASPGPKWFQLYLQPRREDTLTLVRRAEAAGYGALVLTVDAAIQLPGASALRAGFRLPAECVAANLREFPPAESATTAFGADRIFGGLMRTAPTWRDLEWLQAHTRLPIWVKGVLDPQDARRLQAMGVTGVVVSNHGGRGLEQAPASLAMLPVVRAAVGAEYPLLFDGGIRSGADVYKALALGADAVLIGRLQVYALAVAGALGLAHLLRLLREELEVCMALSGCGTLAGIRERGSVEPC